MEAISGISGTSSNPGTLTPPKKPEESAATGDFDTFLKGVLKTGSANQVSEEELFAGLVQERVKKLKGEEIGNQFSAALDTERAMFTRGDGHIAHEDAAKGALQVMVASGALTTEEADKIYSHAFAAAQLDGDSETLYDSRGGEGDPTIAVDTLENALLAARVKIEKIDSGEETVLDRKLNDPSYAGGAALLGSGAAGSGIVPQGPIDLGAPVVTPNGTTVDGPNGFLFKPVTENESKLAVLVPEMLKGRVEQVLLKDSADTLIEEGRFTSYGDEGTRAKFAFSKRGEEYPKDIKVEIRLIDGSTKTYMIPDPSQRYD